MSNGPANVAQEIATKNSADVVLYAGGMWPECDIRFHDTLTGQERRENLFLVLATFGGFPDVAYRVARFARWAYPKGKLILHVPRECMSAGSLMAIAADEIVMADIAQFGPIDVQVRIREEVGERASGLMPMQALEALRGEARTIFFETFKKLRDPFSTRQAADISCRMAIGMLGEMYKQLDPLRVAENRRAVEVATEYAFRIKSAGTREETIARLVAGYPDHGFVIDREEASVLFDGVRPAGELESRLGDELSDELRKALADDRPFSSATIRILSKPQNTVNSIESKGPTDAKDQENHGPGPARAPEGGSEGGCNLGDSQGLSEYGEAGASGDGNKNAADKRSEPVAAK